MARTFTKTRPVAADGYPAEAAGLAWLAAAGPSAARIVRVIEAAPDRLVLERLSPAGPPGGPPRTSAPPSPSPTPQVLPLSAHRRTVGAVTATSAPSR